MSHVSLSFTAQADLCVSQTVFSILQVLLNVLSFHKNLSDSLSLGRLHPQLEPSVIQVDSEYCAFTADLSFIMSCYSPPLCVALGFST